MSYCTEAEAAKRWCPFARVAAFDPDKVRAQALAQSYNRTAVVGFDSKIPEAANCIGSKCMMWQWFAAPHDKDRRGICGLIAKPGSW